MSGVLPIGTDRPRGWGVAAGLVLMLAAGAGHTHEPAHPVTDQAFQLELRTAGPLGSQRLPVDDYTKVTGWELGDGWYFGNYQGEQRGVGLMWQDAEDQFSLTTFSLTTKGLRLVRRF